VLIEAVATLAARLRADGVPVSTSEVIDAARALERLGVPSRAVVRDVLAACLVKRAAHRGRYDAAFDAVFGSAGMTTVGLVGDVDAAAFVEALDDGDDERLEALAAAAVASAGGMADGRFLGVAYHLRRVSRALGLDAALALAPFDSGLDVLDGARRDRARAAIEEALERQVLAAAPEGARRGRRPRDPEALELLRASPGDAADLRRTAAVLGRRLAARLRNRRRAGANGILHVRATMRRSVTTGGVPMQTVLRKRQPHRPSVVVLADVSGSVAGFARFTLQMVHALSGVLSEVRVFVFVDEIDEVTRVFRRGGDIVGVVQELDERAASLGRLGHSDYGAVLDAFAERWLPTVGESTTVIVLGDARTNYHSPRVPSLAAVAERARRLYWLNPEPRSHWDTADSVASEYAAHCDEMFECRTPAQLAAAVDRIV